MDDDAVPEYLRDSVALLKAAFPQDMEEEEYWAVLTILHPYFSSRVLAQLIGILKGRSYVEFLHDVYSAKVGGVTTPRAKAHVLGRLRLHGFDEWVKANSTEE